MNSGLKPAANLAPYLSVKIERIFASVIVFTPVTHEEHSISRLRASIIFLGIFTSVLIITLRVVMFYYSPACAVRNNAFSSDEKKF